MSMGNKAASAAPMVGGVEPDDVSSNQKAVPVRWFVGHDWCPLTWLVREPLNVVYQEIRTKAGKKDTVSGYDIFCDVAGLASLGLVAEVMEIESGRKTVWSGSVVRPDDPEHPDYWYATIVTSVGTFYIWWGRPDQPVPSKVLGPLGTTSSALAHPGYRNQCVVEIVRYDCARNTSVPSTRLKLRRVPVVPFGVFPERDQAEGESIVASALELATSKLFGAAMADRYFPVSTWQALSDDVVANVGCHAPSMTRDRALREVLKDFWRYFDGWARIEAGQLVPGRFPHDGTVPEGLLELSHHDIVGKPTIGASAFPKTANSVSVKFRDRLKKHREDYAGDTARANRRARGRTQPVTVDATAIIDRDQAGKFAAEAARTGAEGEAKGSFDVRRPRVATLKAGDNFQLDWLPYELDQVARVAKITEAYRGSVTIDYVAERGVRPLPYRPPAAAILQLGAPEPTKVIDARVLELTTQLAGTPAALWIAFIAKRPAAEHPGDTAVSAQAVIGFNLWHSADDVSYDLLGNQRSWGVRGLLNGAILSGAGSVTFTADADNLDADRITSPSDEDQLDDQLLLVIGDEVLSVGEITKGTTDWTIDVLRGRQGTQAAGHADGVEAWLVYRDELEAITHKRFVEDTERHFKPQPFTSAHTLDLADADALDYSFRNRDDERPVVVIDALASGLKTGLPYDVTGEITDVNGDLVSFSINAVRIAGGVIVETLTLQAGDFGPSDRAAYAFATKVVFPVAGTWRIAVRAYDERSGYTDEQTGDLSVAANDAAGGYVDYRFKRSATEPTTPTGDDPAGWLDEPASGSDPLWMSKAFKSASGAVVGVWSDPVQLNGDDGADGAPGADGDDGADGADGDSLFVEYSIDGSTSWHFPFADGDIYMRQKVGAGGTWSAAIRIVGEDGAAGASGSSVSTASASSTAIPNSASETTILSLVKTTSSAYIKARLTLSNTSGGNRTADVKLYRDGSLLQTRTAFNVASFGSAELTFEITDTPSAGSHTYELRSQGDTDFIPGNPADFTATTSDMTIIG